MDPEECLIHIELIIRMELKFGYLFGGRWPGGLSSMAGFMLHVLTFVCYSVTLEDRGASRISWMHSLVALSSNKFQSSTDWIGLEFRMPKHDDAVHQDLKHQSILVLPFMCPLFALSSMRGVTTLYKGCMGLVHALGRTGRGFIIRCLCYHIRTDLEGGSKRIVPLLLPLLPLCVHSSFF